jgi:hypothetical protein
MTTEAETSTDTVLVIATPVRRRAVIPEEQARAADNAAELLTNLAAQAIATTAPSTRKTFRFRGTRFVITKTLLQSYALHKALINQFACKHGDRNNRPGWRSSPTWRLGRLFGRCSLTMNVANRSERKPQCSRPKKSRFAPRSFSAPRLRSRQVPLSPTRLEALTSNVMAATRRLSDAYRMNGSRVSGRESCRARGPGVLGDGRYKDGRGHWSTNGTLLTVSERTRSRGAQRRRRRLLIDGPRSAAGAIDVPRNEAALISTRTNVSEASPSTSRLRVKGYRLSCFYGFIDLKCQLTHRMVQYFGFLIERIHFLHKAVDIADVSRALCLSSEVERAKHNEAVSDARQAKRKWSSIFFHDVSLMLLANS